MIHAYRAGVPGNGAFPDGAKMAKIGVETEHKLLEAPFDVSIPDT